MSLFDNIMRKLSDYDSSWRKCVARIYPLPQCSPGAFKEVCALRILLSLLSAELCNRV